MGHALIDETGFFAARNHVNGEAQHFVGAGQKFVTVARFTQGLRRHRAHFGFFKARQPLAKAGQAVQPALDGVGRQVAVFVQPIALAHGFLEVFGAEELAMVHAADFEAKTVGSQIYGGESGSAWQRLIFHRLVFVWVNWVKCSFRYRKPVLPRLLSGRLSPDFG